MKINKGRNRRELKQWLKSSEDYPVLGFDEWYESFSPDPRNGQRTAMDFRSCMKAAFEKRSPQELGSDSHSSPAKAGDTRLDARQRRLKT
jgi:hypothetical protein